MKLTKTKKNKGMTLIELTVVILVLLSLISVLFIGARAWMRGSDRAGAALLIRNAQQGVRSHSNIMGVDTPVAGTNVAWNGAGDLSDEVFGPGKYVETPNLSELPAHPAADVDFVAGAGDFDTVPGLGTLYMTSDTDAAFYAPSGVQ